MKSHPSSPSAPASVVPWARMCLFYVVWVLLAGTGVPALLVGLPAAGISGWLSWRLLPGDRWRWHPSGVVKLVALLLRDSVVAGVEVALMAFRPRLRMNQGIVQHRTRLAEGGMRAFFNTYTGLMPGTLAVEAKDADTLQFHCLDVDAPVKETLQRYEALLIETARRKGGADE